MKKLSLKFIALAPALLAYTFATVGATAVAQTPHTIIAQQQSFTCGPNLLTFVVRPLDNRQGTGVRCVKVGEGTPGNSRLPRLAWYGEGNWGGATYRHLGHAFYRSRELVGSASDFKENIHNNFDQNLTVQLASGSWANPNEIRVTGAWNESWIRVNKANYKPLPRPTSCGGFFDEYKVSDLEGDRVGRGIRCVLKVGQKNTTWFGNGWWIKAHNTYSHVGTRAFNGYGAGDICDKPFGPVCNNFGWGSLKLTDVAPNGFDVTGAWSEKWRS
jgi:hypothetical protein